MAKDPAVLFYTSDFLSGTAFFTDEQRGQYILLLCQQHQLGSIPKDHMIFICKSYDSPVIRKFVQNKDGSYYNVRMRQEHEKRANYCGSRGKNRKGKLKKKSYENHMLGHMENENEDDNKDKDEKKVIPPKIEWVKEYAKKIGCSDWNGFFDYWTSINWFRGRTKMRDWQAAMRTWVNTSKSFSKQLTNTLKSKEGKYDHI